MKFSFLILLVIGCFIGLECDLYSQQYNSVLIQHKYDSDKTKVLKIGDLLRVQVENGERKLFPENTKGKLIEVNTEGLVLEWKGEESIASYADLSQLRKWQRTKEQVTLSAFIAGTAVYIIGLSQSEDDGLFGNLEGAAYTASYLLFLVPVSITMFSQNRHRSTKWEYSPNVE